MSEPIAVSDTAGWLLNRRDLLAGGAAIAATALAGSGALGSDMAQASSSDHLKGVKGFTGGEVRTARHRTAYIEIGRKSGPLLIFVHGHPELGIIWRAQMEHFAAAGWRCVAPDMRGYGGSSAPTEAGAYAVRELVGDMVELHDALGGAPAVWVGHDWGSPVAWAMASHHPERCRAVVNLSVPYFARGFALPHLVALVDRKLYPIDRYPAGQWDYWLHYRESFASAQRDFEADVPATMAALYRRGDLKAVGKPAFTADLRARGGWFGPARRAPAIPPDPSIVSRSDYDLFVAAFERTGFRGANAWYLNDAANIDFAGEAKDFGRIQMPVLFLHGELDVVCETVKSHLADPMRADCRDLSEVKILAGHFLMLEKSAEVNAAVAKWVVEKV